MPQRVFYVALPRFIRGFEQRATLLVRLTRLLVLLSLHATFATTLDRYPPVPPPSALRRGAPLQGASVSATVLTTPLFFGSAHLHHLLELWRFGGRTLPQAVPLVRRHVSPARFKHNVHSPAVCESCDQQTPAAHHATACSLTDKPLTTFPQLTPPRLPRRFAL